MFPNRLDERLAAGLGSLMFSKWLDGQILSLSADLTLKETSKSVNYIINTLVFSEERPNKATMSESELHHSFYKNGSILKYPAAAVIH